MGFFSGGCKRCERSMLSEKAAGQSSFKWMTQVVVITADGNLFQGTYDGYGRIFTDSGDEIDVSEVIMSREGDAFHSACWKAFGKPTAWSGQPMVYSRDQGWFFKDEKYESVPFPG